MNKTRNLANLASLLTVDDVGQVSLSASPTPADNSGNLATTSWTRDHVSSQGYATDASVNAGLATKQPLISGTGFVKVLGSAVSYDNSSYITGINSGQVTTALGYTPVPNSRSLSINGVAYDLSADRSWTIAAGLTSFNTRTGAITLVSLDVTSALGYTPYNATNPNGYITGITSANVTAALGFTPYNSSNPSGYITGITSANVTTALGFTPYNATNPNGYITSSGSISGSAGSVAWTNVSGRPTAVSSFTNDSGYITSTGNASKLNPLSGDVNYKLAYTADSARTNAGEWGRAVMYYVPNGQTYGIRVDRADYADSAGSAGTVTLNANRSDAAKYPVVWATGASSPLYSASAVTIQSSTGMLSSNIIETRKISLNNPTTTGAAQIFSHSRSAVTGGVVQMIGITTTTPCVLAFRLFLMTNDNGSTSSGLYQELLGLITFNGSTATVITSDQTHINANSNNGASNVQANPTGYSNYIVFSSGNSTGAGGLHVSMLLEIIGKNSTTLSHVYF